MRRERGPFVVVWASRNPPGVERCTLSQGPPGWLLEGDLVRRFKGGPAVISYSIQTDPRWLTKVARVEQVYEGERRSLTVEVKDSRWHVRGKRDPRLDGCLDIDLEASPVTNTLAIRRTALRVGTRA